MICGDLIQKQDAVQQLFFILFKHFQVVVFISFTDALKERHLAVGRHLPEQIDHIIDVAFLVFELIEIAQDQFDCFLKYGRIVSQFIVADDDCRIKGRAHVGDAVDIAGMVACCTICIIVTISGLQQQLPAFPAVFRIAAISSGHIILQPCFGVHRLAFPGHLPEQIVVDRIEHRAFRRDADAFHMFAVRVGICDLRGKIFQLTMHASASAVIVEHAIYPGSTAKLFAIPVGGIVPMRVFGRIQIKHEDMVFAVFTKAFQDSWIRIGQPRLNDPHGIFVIFHHLIEDIGRHFRFAQIRRDDAAFMCQISGIIIGDLSIDEFLGLVKLLGQLIIAIIGRLQDRRSGKAGPIALGDHIIMDIIIAFITKDRG